MDKKDEQFTLHLSGQGFNFDGKVSATVGRQVIALVIQDPLGTAFIPVAAHSLAPSAVSTAASIMEPSAPSAKAFLAQRRPATDIERVACLAYYLTHYKQTEVFKTKDLSLLNSEAALPRFANTANAVKNAVKVEFLVPAGGGLKRITMRAEELVKALPDRTAVKMVMTNNPPMKKSNRPRRDTKRVSGQ